MPRAPRRTVSLLHLPSSWEFTGFPPSTYPDPLYVLSVFLLDVLVS